MDHRKIQLQLDELLTELAHNSDKARMIDAQGAQQRAGDAPTPPDSAYCAALSQARRGELAAGCARICHRVRRRYDRDGRGGSRGRILGPGPGLEEAALYERAGLAVKTDYRQVLTELLTFDGGEAFGPNVFPGCNAAAQLGIVA
jgi:hypothetical protein